MSIPGVNNTLQNNSQKNVYVVVEDTQVSVENLNAELLAPGTHMGRLTVWTNSAFEKVESIFGGK